jgi:hypothetical protein
MVDGFASSGIYYDDSLTSRAHSCGAVAEFHRLPEHPGVIRLSWPDF